MHLILHFCFILITSDKVKPFYAALLDKQYKLAFRLALSCGYSRISCAMRQTISGSLDEDRGGFCNNELFHICKSMQSSSSLHTLLRDWHGTEVMAKFMLRLEFSHSVPFCNDSRPAFLYNVFFLIYCTTTCYWVTVITLSEVIKMLGQI